MNKKKQNKRPHPIESPKLSVREEEALCYYIEQKCENHTEAMVKAGFNKSTAWRMGKKLLGTQKAKDFIAAKVSKALQKYNYTSDDLLSEVALIAFSDHADYFIKTDNDGIALKNIFDMGPSRRAIKKIKHTQTVTDFNGVKTVENKFEYELWNKDAAQRLLAEHHGIAKEGGEGNTVVKTLVYLPGNERNQQ